MKKAFLTIVTCAMATATMPIATPVMAQGSLAPMPKAKDEKCPTNWSQKTDKTACVPSSLARPAYRSATKKCAAGYEQSWDFCVEKGPSTYTGPAADRLVSYGTITKANRLDRCPLGHFSKSDMTTCSTRLSPAPKSRKKTGACNSNEIDEWGLWCTADANVITREQAVMEADRDFNAIYSANGANYPNQGNDTENYPSMVAAYGPKGGSPASAAASSSGSDQGSNGAQCQASGNGAAQGAAVGGAVAGQAGAVIGGMIGGFGKKKKKSGC